MWSLLGVVSSECPGAERRQAFSGKNENSFCLNAAKLSPPGMSKDSREAELEEEHHVRDSSEAEKRHKGDKRMTSVDWRGGGLREGDESNEPT